MPNELKTEVKFTVADLDEIIKSGAYSVIVSCNCSLGNKSEWTSTVTAQGKDEQGANVGSPKGGCPMPC